MTVKRTVQVSIQQHSQSMAARTLEKLLFKLSLCDLNLDRLVHLLHVAALVVGIVLDGGREKRVDEGRLSEARLASNLSLSVRLLAPTCMPVLRTMMVKFAPRFATILCLSQVRLAGALAVWREHTAG